MYANESQLDAWHRIESERLRGPRGSLTWSEVWSQEGERERIAVADATAWEARLDTELGYAHLCESVLRETARSTEIYEAAYRALLTERGL